MNAFTKPFLITFTSLLSVHQAGAQRLPLSPEVKTGKLSNGFTYFIRKNTEPQKRATLYLVVKAGSILEKENQLGLAHFMEHMSFNGTQHFPKNELVEYLQKSGIRFGADLNAYTSFDETVYQLPIPTDDQKLFDNGLLIMRDWAGAATLDPTEIDKERGVVLEEKRLRKGVSARLEEKLLPFQFNNSRYAHRLPIGTEQVLTTFKKQDIQSFYQDWYRPDLEALIVVGDIEPLAVEKQVRRLFANLKSDRKITRTPYQATLSNKPRFIALSDPELPQTSVELDFKVKSLGEGTRVAYQARLLRNLCGILLAERLSDLGKDPAAPVLQVQGAYQPVINGIDAMSIEFAAKDGQLKAGFDQVYTVLLQAKRFGFSAAEIGRAKTQLLSQLAALVRDKDKQPSSQLADELKRHFLVGEAAPGIAYEYQLTKSLLSQISSGVITAELNCLLDETNRDLIVLAPQPSGLPTEATVNRWLVALHQQPLIPYTDKVIGESLLSKLPQPGQILSETTEARLGTTTWKLSNGATVILKPTHFKNDEVFFQAFSPGGSSLVSDADYESLTNAPGIIRSSGLGPHDAVTLPKLLAGKQAVVVPYLTERFEGLQGESTKNDLPTAMQLAYLYFTEPRKDSALFNRIISNAAQRLATRYSDPQAVLQDSLAAVLSNYNERRTGPSLAKLNRINLDRVYDLYQQRFANAGDFTFIFTGSFTPAEIRPLVAQYIAALPGTPNVTEKAKDLGIHPPAGNLFKTVYAGKEDKATVLLIYHGSYAYSAAENLRLTALADILQFKMTERLRETEGGAYAPAVRFQREHDAADHYQLLINFGCAPANTDKLIAAALEEIATLQHNGPTADDLQKFKSEESRQLELNQQSNDYWLNYLTTKLQNGEDLYSLLSQAQRIQALSAADVHAAARQYLKSDLIRFVQLPVPNDGPNTGQKSKVN